MAELLLDNLDTIVAIVTAVLTALALFASWRSWRKAELRREEVQEWANEAIAALQALRLITSGARLQITAAETRTRLSNLMFDTSILVERGRLFFRNARRGGQGREKHPAYRGSRPDILDQLVLAHQIACAWPTANADARARMRVLADDAVRRFVSLMQEEVGRVRTAAASTRRGGQWSDLEERLAEIAV